MNKTNIKIPFFSTGDIGGLTYTITNNIVNYLIVIATLSGVLAWPDEIVYGRVIPGMSIGLLLSGLYFSFLGILNEIQVGNMCLTSRQSFYILL